MILLSTAENSVQTRWIAGLSDRDHLNARDESQLKDLLDNEGPEMVLLDLALPGLNGIERVIELIKANPATRFVVMTPTPDDDK